jgi:thiamine-phosphate pyrophosphorylase
LKKDTLKEIDFYMVTDSGLSRKGTLNDVEQALKADCRIIQYREKCKSTKEMIEEGKCLKSICKNRAILLVNDRVDVALAIDADGVHIGQDDMPFMIAREQLGEGKIIGVTVHNVEEALSAERAGADYFGLSPIFETGTKKDAGKACGLSMITEVRKRTKLPIVAIGGIIRGNVEDVIRAGADAAVAISAVVNSEDVYRETEMFIEIIRNVKKLI